MVDWLSAAERLTAIDRSTVVLDTQRCLHSHDRFATCKSCFDVCPDGAIRPGKPPALDSQRCSSCLACLPVCPAGAYAADDAVPALRNCAVHLETGTLELVCKRHPAAQTGLASESVGVRVRGCLAGLGSAAYLALAALGLERILIRLDACDQCPWSSLLPLIRKQIGQAGHLLNLWEKMDLLQVVSSTDGGTERPLWDADNPPLSRRDLFRMMARQGQLAMARAMAGEHATTGQRRPGRDRLRILGAVAHLPEVEVGQRPLPEDLGFAAVSVSESCTACEACARACPTGTLQFERNEVDRSYRLSFVSESCIGCEICLHVCAPAAIEVSHKPSFHEIFGQSGAVVLQEGELSRCRKCNIYFAARPGVQLCPLCEFRRSHPFGSMMPPGFKGRGQPISGRDSDDH
ncbi:MAG: 4Fe-4S dicluster domain-containing protein [Anaerolineales bacterium]